jgi:hypothetical protein
MDGDEGKTFYVIRFLDHFFENYCIELPYQYFISFNSGLAIRSSMDPVRLLYLHDPTWPQSGPTFIPARSDLIRRGLAIRSDYYTCLYSHADVYDCYRNAGHQILPADSIRKCCTA